MSGSTLSKSTLVYADTIYDLQNHKYNYTGNVDNDGLRKEYGCQIWNEPCKHKYAGNFLYNNLHDKGFYFIRQENKFSFYDGQFYNNKLEGYGQIVHDNGTIFEGLFKSNKRFGPGVVTYPNGSQDVGFWNSNTLIRLSTSVCPGLVPTLCNSRRSKIRLLRFRKLVPALPERIDIAKSLLHQLNINDVLGHKYSELYNPQVRNGNSLFFNRELYDLKQLGSEDAFIEVLEDESLADLKLDETTTEGDTFTPTVNDRCTYISQQIQEINVELKRIKKIKANYEQQLRKCKKCCRNSEQGISQLEFDNLSVSENQKNTSAVSISSKNMPRENIIQTNFDEIEAQSTAIDMDEFQSQNLTEKLRENSYSDGINKLYINQADFGSSQTVESKIHSTLDKLEPMKYECKCGSAQIADVDFLISEKDKLSKQEVFYQTVIDFLNSVLFKEATKKEQAILPKTVKILVEDLLAWNNEKISIEILQHCFRYRNFERILSFSIKSLLIGERNMFGQVGNMELNAINFLKHCAGNELDEVKKDLFLRKVYVDLSDARGNTGLHFAISSDSHGIAKLLANMGANLNAFNDECITPLLLSLLRYIAAINEVVFWEEAFLPDTVLNRKELEELTQWRPHESLVSLGEFMISSCRPSNDTQIHQNDSKLSSLVKLSAKIKSHLQTEKNARNFAKGNVGFLLSTSFPEQKVEASRKKDKIPSIRMQHIEKTIAILLHYGANPNIGNLPMSPVLLAIFSRNTDIVEMLLNHGANPNTVTEDNLTGLHILASLPFTKENIEIAEIFLKYSCNPNIKSNNDFWLEQNDELIGSNLPYLDDSYLNDGKTPLKMVVMRKNFNEDNSLYQCTLVKLLIEHGAIYNDEYLGHSLLSIAVLRGNLNLIQTLFGYVNPKAPLGRKMGNALTVLGLNRFPSVMQFDRCKDTIDTLVSLGMNPFDSVYNFPNAFEFLSSDYGENTDYNVQKLRNLLENEQIKLRNEIYSGKNTSPQNSNKLSFQYLKEIGRSILTYIYQYQIMQYLFMFASDDIFKQKCVEKMAKFFTIDEAIDTIKIMIHNNKIHAFNSQQIILNVLSFIHSQTAGSKTSKKKVFNKLINLELEMEKLKTNTEIPTYLKYIQDNNPEKYEVCFHCLKKDNQPLITCPCCGAVKFCSLACNKFNSKINKKHVCKVMFYNNNITSAKRKLDIFSSFMTQAEIKQGKEKDKLKSTLKKIFPELEALPSQHSMKQKDHLSTSTEKSASIPVSEEAKQVTQVYFGEPFESDENLLAQNRKVKCGFHCGQVIQDVQLDAVGNIVREHTFCDCYPLYKEYSELDQKQSDDISKLFNEKQYLDDQLRAETYKSSDKQKLENIGFKKLLQHQLEENSRLDGHSINRVENTENIDENQKYILERNITRNEGTSTLEKETVSNCLRQNHDVTLNKFTEGKEEEINDKRYISSKPPLEEVPLVTKQRIPDVMDVDGKGVTDKLEYQNVRDEKKMNLENQTKSPAGMTEQSHKEVDNRSKAKALKKDEQRDDRLKDYEANTGKQGRQIVDETTSEKQGQDQIKPNGYKKTSKKKDDQQQKGKKTSPEVELDEYSKTTDDVFKRTYNNKSKNIKQGLDYSKGNNTQKNRIQQDSEENKEKLMNFRSEKGRTGIEAGRNIKAIENFPEKSSQVMKKEENNESSKSTERLRNLKSKTAKNKLELEHLTQIKKNRKKDILSKANENKDKDKEKKIERNVISGALETTRSGRPKTSKKYHMKERSKGEKGPYKSDNTRRLSQRKKHIESGIKESRCSKKSESSEESEQVRGQASVQEKAMRDCKLYKEPIARKGPKFSNKLTEGMTPDEKYHFSIVKGRGQPADSMKNITFKYGPNTLLDLNSTNFETLKRVSKPYQYFLELVQRYFPEFDLEFLLLPFACFLDGQLYYKFTDTFPYYYRTYSSV